jgi:hypothetical protein
MKENGKKKDFRLTLAKFKNSVYLVLNRNKINNFNNNKGQLLLIKIKSHQRRILNQKKYVKLNIFLNNK